MRYYQCGANGLMQVQQYQCNTYYRYLSSNLTSATSHFIACLVSTLPFLHLPVSCLNSLPHTFNVCPCPCVILFLSLSVSKSVQPAHIFSNTLCWSIVCSSLFRAYRSHNCTNKFLFAHFYQNLIFTLRFWHMDFHPFHDVAILVRVFSR